MKKIILFIGLALFTVSINAQIGEYSSHASFNKDFVGKSVADLLRALEERGVPIGSFVVNPNYKNPEYANEFRFSNKDVNTTSAIITDNNNPFDSEKLHVLYVQFKPQIKYPTTGFIKDNKEKALTPAVFMYFAKYKITDIDYRVLPR